MAYPTMYFINCQVLDFQLQIILKNAVAEKVEENSVKQWPVYFVAWDKLNCLYNDTTVDVRIACLTYAVCGSVTFRQTVT